METITNQKIHTREQIKDIILDISWAKLANRYFNRSPSWIYHKIDGIDGNGGIGGFSHQELEQFKKALYDLSERIKKTADSLPG